MDTIRVDVLLVVISLLMRKEKRFGGRKEKKPGGRTAQQATPLRFLDS
jgi:hypothetical protein